MHKLTHSTAVVVIPPQDAWPAIQPIRTKHDAKVRRWMPHITLVYPCLPVSEFPAAQERLAIACRDVPAFEVELADFRTFRHRRGNCTIWLAPKPEAGLVELQAVVQRAAFGEHFAGGRPAGFQPHLSIGQVQGTPEMLRLVVELQAAWENVRFTVACRQPRKQAGFYGYFPRRRLIPTTTRKEDASESRCTDHEIDPRVANQPVCLHATGALAAGRSSCRIADRRTWPADGAGRRSCRQREGGSRIAHRPRPGLLPGQRPRALQRSGRGHPDPHGRQPPVDYPPPRQLGRRGPAAADPEDQSVHLAVGLGTIHWPATIRPLDEIEYKRPAVIEGARIGPKDKAEQDWQRGVSMCMANWRAIEALARDV